jgi:hypothetical protein
MKRYNAIILGAVVAAMLTCVPVNPAWGGSVSVSGRETSSDASNLRLTDPHKELRYWSKNLKLKRDQRSGVSIILQERTRVIQLLLNSESVSQGYRNSLATKVMQDSDAQIESLLRAKQKLKFEKELAKNR